MMRTIFLFFFLINSFAVFSEPILWNGKHKYVDIGKSVSFLEDPAGKLTIEQVSLDKWNSKFKKSEKEILNFGLSESAFWLKFSVRNSTNQSLWVELAQPFLPVADMYFKDSTGHWHVTKAGYTVNLAQKQVKHFAQVFALPNSTTPIYIRFVSYSHPIPIRIWHDQAFEIKADEQHIIYGIYVGLLIFIIINNLFLFVSLRKIPYLHYAILVSIYLLISAFVMDGYIVYLLPNLNLIFWYNFLPLVAMPVAALYGIIFLEIWKYSPLLFKVSKIFIVYIIIYLLFSHLFSVLSLTMVLAINQIQALINIGLALVMGIQAGRKGNRIGKYYALAYGLYFLIVLVEIVYIQTGKPPHIWGISHVAIASLIEVFILTYALSKRFEWEQKDVESAKVEVQQQLLEKTRENERILRTQNETLEKEVDARTKVIAHKSLELQQSLDDLKATQNQLIQREKMASLGELTAGIAHEIQNPLNFVNNFSELSDELVGELVDELERGDAQEAKVIAAGLSQNLQKISDHGKRASAIVKGMLEHSRSAAGERQLNDLNRLADEYLKLAYNGVRAKNKSFTCELVTDFVSVLPPVEIVPQEIGRVLLNLYNNAFYAVEQKQKITSGTGAYQPAVRVSTRQATNPAGRQTVEISVKDNGMGIPDHIKAKIFQPFFTTKPTGEGTGLGLSLSYDIITKGHQGSLHAESQEGQGTEFTVELPV